MLSTITKALGELRWKKRILSQSSSENDGAIRTTSSNLPRIIFLDLLRAVGTILMVQSHTIDVLLADVYRSYDYTGFKVWQFVRGLTAPTFLLTTGMVFVYLLRSTTAPLRHNPRVVKGIRRSLLLFVIGYLLHFPASSLSDILAAPPESWRTFWAVDVLQLIGIGLLLLLFSVWLSEKLGGKDRIVFGIASLVFFVGAPFAERVNWNALLY